jgi:hypothetical protein
MFACEQATFFSFEADPDPDETLYFDVDLDPDPVKLDRVFLSFLEDCSKFSRFVLKAFLMKYVCYYNSKLVNCINLQKILRISFSKRYDPDPDKLWPSDRIRIPNTACELHRREGSADISPSYYL